MATTNKFTTTGTPVTLLGSGLNSMASQATVLGSAVNNAVGTANLDGYKFGTFQLALAAPTTALEEGVGYLWFISSVDNNSTYADASASLKPRRLPNVVFYIPAGAGAQVIDGVWRKSPDWEELMVGLPSSYFKPLFYLGIPSGQLAASGNTLKVLAHTDNV